MQDEREPILGSMWGEKFGPLSDAREAHKAMGWATVVILWLAGSVLFYGIMLDTKEEKYIWFGVAAILMGFAIPVYFRKRAWVLIVIILGAANTGFEIWYRVSADRFVVSGMFSSVVLAYATYQAYRGWRYKPRREAASGSST